MILFPLTGYARETQTPDITSMDNGAITFYFADQNLQCGFPFGGSANFVEAPRDDSDYCKELKNGGYFKLNNVPSASNIYLISARSSPGQSPSAPKNCTPARNGTTNYGWWKLTTVKQPTSMTDKVRIEDLKTISIPGMVVPGVRLVDSYKSGNDSDTITCAIMEVSP